MSAQDQYEPADAELIRLASQAGASHLFLQFMAIDPTEYGQEKNIAAMTVRRYAEDYSQVADQAAAVAHVPKESGGFIEDLWLGNLAEVLYRADGTNTTILFNHFDREYLLGVLIDERGTVESAERWLDDHYPRYEIE